MMAGILASLRILVREEKGEREFALRVGSGLFIWKDPIFRMYL